MHDSRRRNHFPGAEKLLSTVEVVEPIGSELILIVSYGDLSLTAKVDSESDAKPGMVLNLLIDMNKIHIFDKNTEKAY